MTEVVKESPPIEQRPERAPQRTSPSKKNSSPEELYPVESEEEAHKVLQEKLIPELREKRRKKIAVGKPPTFTPEEILSFDSPQRLPVKTRKKPEPKKLSWWEKFKENIFWTPERIEEAKQVYEAVNKYVAQYGAESTPFDKSRIKLFTPFHSNFIHALLHGGAIVGGWYYPLSGLKALNMTTIQLKPEWFSTTLAHELLHRRSTSFIKMLEDKPGFGPYTGSLHRFGLAMEVKKARKRQFGTEYVFRWLMEAITDRAVEKIMYNLGKPVSPGYSRIREFYRRIVENIAQYQKIVGRPTTQEKIEEAFEKATFGQGHALDMARLIDQVYKDIGGFKVFAEKMMIYDAHSSTLNPFKKIFEQAAYKEALRFLQREGEYQFKVKPILKPKLKPITATA